MEIWKTIPETNGIYEASNYGNIRSIDRMVKHNYGGNKFTKGRILKLNNQPNGYLGTSIFINGKEKRVLVHRIIALTFYGKSDLQVNHINGNKKDNRLENLEYCTPSQNLKHAFRIGLSSNKGERHSRAKFSDKQAIEIHHLANSNVSLQVLAKKYNVAVQTIVNIKYGNNYRHLFEHKSNAGILR